MFKNGMIRLLSGLSCLYPLSILSASPPPSVSWLCPWFWTQLCLTLSGSRDSLNHPPLSNPLSFSHTHCCHPVDLKQTQLNSDPPTCECHMFGQSQQAGRKTTKVKKQSTGNLTPTYLFFFFKKKLCDDVILTHVTKSLLCQHGGDGIVLDRSFIWGAAWRDHPVLTVW